MVAGHDLTVKSEAGHEQEAPVSGAAQVDPDRLAGGDHTGQDLRIASQAEVLGHEVFCARREYGQRHVELVR